MALLTARGRRRPSVLLSCGLACSLALVAQGCRLADPIIASGNYEVQAKSGTKVTVQLKGGKGVSRLRQRDIIQDFMLDLSQDPERESAAFDAMLDLESLFERRGFPIAHVDQHVERKTDGTRVTFNIEQGPQVVLEELLIEGNTSIDDKILLDYWSRLQSEVLGFGDDLYVLADLEALRSGITSHYRRLGYLDVDVKLGQPRPALGPSITKVQVTIQVTEGPRYYSEEVHIHPKLARSLKEGAPTPPRVGSPFVSQDIQNYALQVAHYLRQHGHADPEVRTTLTPKQETHKVAITLHGDPGPVVKVKRIVVRGLSFTSLGVIRKHIDIPTGELFNGDKEEASLSRLFRSGLFRKIDVRHEPAGPGEINIAFEFEQTTRYLLEAMVGYGSHEEFRAGLEFEMLSVLGTGFDFNAQGSTSTKGYRIVTSISDSQFMPWLLGYDTTFSITGDTFRREEPAFTDEAIGVSPSLSHNFTNTFSGRVAYIFREHRDVKSTVIDPGALFSAYTESSALVEFAYDSRDNPLIPKKGTRISAQFKHYGDLLGGDVLFERLRLTASTVLPISKSTRFVVNAEAAGLFPQGSKRIIPIQERLFNGGENTVRSFREDKLAPMNLKDITGQVIGGEYRNVFNAEIRWAPPFQITRAVEFEFALFGDAGNLGKSINDYGLDDMKYAIGAGLRFILPIGPVRFDVARNPDRQPGDREWTLHFSIGYPF